MSTAFFISDVHLKKMASPTGEALLSLIMTAQKQAQLFVILGDLFDMWIGKGRVFQKEYAPIIKELETLKKTCRILYFEGNHDLHLKAFWEKELGCEVYTGPQQFEWDGLKIWAEHGDEINQKDKGYLFLRWFLRAPGVRHIIKAAPSLWVKTVGDRASKQSRKYSARSHGDPKIRDIYRNYAQSLREKTSFDLLVTGHSHIADDFKFTTSKGQGRLINLGSWFDGPKTMKIENAQISFVNLS